MRKLSLLTDLNAFDPLPALGVKIDKTPKPAAPDPLLAIHDFERTPHELSSLRPRPAGQSTACGSDGAAAPNAKQPREDILGSFVPDGDQRDQGESGGWHSHAGGHAAGDQADSGDPWCCVHPSLETQAGFRKLLESKAGQTGRSSLAGSAVKPPSLTGQWDLANGSSISWQRSPEEASDETLRDRVRGLTYDQLTKVVQFSTNARLAQAAYEERLKRALS